MAEKGRGLQLEPWLIKKYRKYKAQVKEYNDRKNNKSQDRR